MTVQLPELAPGAGQQWQLADVGRLIVTGQTDGAGDGTITCPPLDSGRLWEITRAVVGCAGTTPQPICRLYIVPAGQAVDQQYLVSGTLSGLFDEADYPGDGLWVLEGEQLLAVWTGAPAGERLTLNLQRRVKVLP